MPNTIPIFSEPMKFVFPLHRYGKYVEETPYDILCGLNTKNVLYYVVVDKIQFELKSYYIVHYYSKALQAIKEIFPDVDAVDLKGLDGFWHTEFFGKHHTTLFLYLYDSANNLYLVQVDFDDMNPQTNFSVTPIKKFFGSPYLVTGLMIKENFIYSDTKSVDTYDTYLVYIDCQPGEHLGGKVVRGCRVLVTTEEKQEFINSMPDVTFPIAASPVVDVWSDKDIVLYKLPDDAKELQFQFSNGLAFVKFDSSTDKYEEGFTV